jgi:hypothetical protein
MRGAIIRRICALEQRVLPSEAEQLPRLPEWLLKGWEAHLGVPVNDYGRPEFAAIKPDQAEQRAAPDSIPAGMEEGRSPDVTLASKTVLRFD